MPVAQIVAGFTKVFVGEIVEKGVKCCPSYHVANLGSNLGPCSSCRPGASWRKRSLVSGPSARGVPHVPGRDGARWRRAAITREKALHAMSTRDTLRRGHCKLFPRSLIGICPSNPNHLHLTSRR